MKHMKRKKRYNIETQPALKPGRLRFNQGSPFVIPSNMTPEEYTELYLKWNKKLQKSGHSGIEDFSPRTGRFSPYFYSTSQTNDISGSARTAMAAIRPDKAAHYHMCSVFYELADFKQLFYMHKIYKQLMFMYKDGKSYRYMLKQFNLKRKKKRSIFWIHWHMQRIMAVMKQWHTTNPDGLLYVHKEKLPDLWEVYLEDLKGGTK